MTDLVVIGSYNHDLIFAADQLPTRGETCFAELHRAHGGKGFNQAIAANRLGANTLFIAAVGQDGFARSADRFAKDERLECAWHTVDQATGVASVGVEQGGENQILVAPGANQQLSVDHIRSHATQVAAAKVLLVQLETAAAPIEFAFGATKATRILNPAPFSATTVQRLTPQTDIITPNETEFAALTAELGRPLPSNWQQRDDGEIQNWCRQLGIETVIITLGAAGVFISQPRQFKRIPAPTVEALDTTGAGDAFNGALAAGLIRFDNDLDQAVELAIQAAALSVTRTGAAPAMATIEELSV